MLHRHSALGSLLLLVLSALTVRAELPPGEYERLQSEAPEVFLIRITNVKEVERSGPDTRNFVCSAEIRRVERSAAGHKRGETIRFKSYYVQPEAFRSGRFAGAQSPPGLREGWQGRVYLEGGRDGADLDLAAYGRSFVAMAVPALPIPDPFEGHLLYVRAWRADLRAANGRVIAQMPFLASSTVEQSSQSRFLIRAKDTDGNEQWGWISRNDVLTRPPFSAEEQREDDRTTALFTQKRKLREQKKHQEAIPVYEQIVSIYQSLYGRSHPLTAVQIFNLADTHESVGDFERAQQLLTQCVQLESATLGRDHPSLATTLSRLGFVSKKTMQYDSAILYFSECLRIERQVLKDSEDTAITLANLASSYESKREFNKAEDACLECLAMRIRLFGVADARTKSAFDDLISLYKTAGKSSKAERLSLGNLTSDQVLGLNADPFAPIPAGATVNVTVEGAPLKEQAARSQLSQGSSLTVRQAQGSWLYVEGHSGQRKHVGWVHQNHVALPGTPTNLGEEPVPLASLLDSRVVNPADIFMYQKLAVVACAMMDCGREVDLMRCGPELLGRTSHLTAALGRVWHTDFHRILGEVHLSAGDREKGFKLLDRACELAAQMDRDFEAGRLEEPAGSAYHLWTFEIIGICGRAQAIHGRLIPGERNMARATAKFDKDPNVGPLVYGRMHTAHAEALLQLNRVAQARGQLETALKLDEAFRAANNFQTRPYDRFKDASGTAGWPESLLALCHAHDDNRDAAFKTMNDAQRGLHKFWLFTGHVEDPDFELTHREKRLRPEEDVTNYALSLARHFSNHPQAAELSAQWVLNRKFKQEELLQRQAEVVRRNQGGGFCKLAYRPRFALAGFEPSETSNERILEARGLAAGYRLRSFANEDRDDAMREFDTLRYVGAALRSTRLFDQEAFAQIPQREDVAARTWLDIPKVQALLKPKQVLIEFVRYEDFDIPSLGKIYRWLPQRYAAWIIPAQGAVTQIDLGPAAAIDKSIRQARSSIQAAGEEKGTIFKRGEPEAAQEFLNATGDLSQNVLAKLRPHIQDADELLLCPDGALWLAPWAALPWSEGEYLIERFGLRFLTTGRELLPPDQRPYAQAEPAVGPGPAVIIANPNFDLLPKDVLAAERAALGSELPLSSIVVAHRGKNSVPNFAPLEYSAAEAKEIAPSIATYAKAEPKVYLGDMAVEGLLGKMNRPRVLVLSTHGFFGTPRNAQAGIRELDIRDPTMQSGLALAGCNRRDDWPTARAADGVLTAYEVAALDLRGTELVVLSACDTGVGDVRAAEGVVGLRQAFQVAGAKFVVSTLWSVPDRDSALLMKNFFEKLANGSTKSAALRSAQLERIQSRRQRFGAAHPLFWAGWTLTGG